MIIQNFSSFTNSKMPEGTHIIADFKNIDFERLKINEKDLKVFFSRIISKNKLTELGNYYHTFGNENEITGVIALAESHISFHTWPEFQYMSIDIFVCNLKNDNSLKVKNIFEEIVQYFHAEKIEKRIVKRNIK